MLRRLILLTLLVTLLTAACRTAAPATSPTPASTRLAFAPTATRTPRPTATPTRTPRPTNTPAPPATLVPAGPPIEAQLEGLFDEQFLLPGESLTLRFNQPMDPASVDSPLRLTPSREINYAWSEGNEALTFTLPGTFAADRPYQLFLHPELKSAAGALLGESLSWDFHTVGKPRITVRTPSSDVVALQPVFRLTFDRPMDQASVASALTLEPAVAFTLRWEQVGQPTNLDGGEASTTQPADTLIVEVSDPLTPGQLYDAAIASSAQDQWGLSLATAYRWSFQLAPVSAHLTSRDANNPLAPMILRLSYPSLNELLLRQSFDIDPAVEGDLTISEDGDQTVLTFQPDAPLAPSTAYTLLFTLPLLDNQGHNVGQPEALNFTTPSIITSVDPQPVEQDWWSDYYQRDPMTDIRVSFSRPMDAASTNAAFDIQPAVDGEFEWNGNTLIFHPAGGHLAGYTDYDVTIGTTARDAEGNRVLPQPYGWSFRTGDLWSTADFGNGLKVQVLDADGRRAVQYRTSVRQPVTTTFSLYRLEVGQVPGHFLTRDFTPLPAELAATWTISTTPNIGTDDDYFFLNPQETIIPDTVEPGPYVMLITAGDYQDYLLLFLTHYTLVVKQAGSQVTIWATDINPGDAGATGLEVNLFDDEGSLLAGGQTNGMGVFQATVTGTPVLVTARNGTDVTASGMGSVWRSQQASGAPRSQLAYIYTDRPIYRPGHTVYFKAILRLNEDAHLTPFAEGTAVTARILDGRNNIVQTYRLTTNHFGTINGQFQLAEGAGLGNYQVEVVLASGNARQTFKVEEYRKPDYEVSVTTGPAPNNGRYLVGDTITVTVETNYFFGEPVADAEVTIQPFQSDWGGWYTDEEPFSGRTDADGHYTFSFPAQLGTWAIEATVDDGSNQTVSSHATVRVFNVAERLSLDTGRWRKEPGQTFTSFVTIQDIFDRPVNGRLVHFTLRRYDPDFNGYQNVQSFNRTTGANGRIAFDLTLDDPGYYELNAWATDRLGNRIESGRSFYIYSPNSLYNRWYGGSSTLGIQLDAPSYAPGETARLFITSPFSGPALLTLERANVRSQQLVELTSPMTVVELPIQDADTPNIYATLHAWQPQDTRTYSTTQYSLADANLLMTAASINVSLDHKTLNVAILTDKETYAPGETATIVLRATNYLGDPVSAELSLGVVDEAIYSLSPDLSASMLDTFYFRRPNQVATDHAFRPVRSLWYSRPYEGGMGGGDGDGGMTGAPRRDFQDTAAWFPTLQTDANGLVTVTFTLPDNITSWRLTARGTTGDTQVGYTITNIIARQPLIVRPLLPTVLTAGDQWQLSALVHNYTERSQTLTVTAFEVDGQRLDINSPITQTVIVASGEVRVVGWAVTALSAGDTRLLVRAGNATVADAVELPLPIRPLAIPDVTTLVGDFNGVYSTTIHVPADALDLSTVRIELSRSIAGSMMQGLEYLTGYPYGCVEQTMSRALPNAVVGRVYNQLGVTDPTLVAQLEPLVRASVQRLYGFQHSDGGWGWWTDDATHDYQTAWVVFGLATTAEAGYEVDPAVIQRGAAWLQGHLYQMDPRTRAFALYSMALAGSGSLADTQLLAAQRHQLDTFSQAALALALHNLGEEAAAREIVELLADTAVTSGGLTYWQATDHDGYYGQKTMASSTRSTALALSAFVQITPNHPLEAGIVRWLMSQRRGQGWGTTNETAFTILALTDHLVALNNAGGNTTTDYTLSLDGRPIFTGTLGLGAPNVTLELPFAELQAGPNQLRLEHSAAGSLYYVINSRMLRPQEAITATGPIQVSRVYLDATTGRPVTATLFPNQVVQVQLTVNLPTAGSYMIVEDSLPAGLEALNDRLDTTSLLAEEEIYYWQERGYNYKEIRDGRVSFFITDMAAGAHTFTYYARATYSGQFVAMPVEVYGMYNLTNWGRSASMALHIAQ